MRIKKGILIISGLLFFIFIGSAEAGFRRYTYSYDISEIEWQFLNWTAAWRGTTILADPFTLDRMAYDRKTKKANIYLSGKDKDASEINLNRSLEQIISLFNNHFPPEFDAKTDLVIHYILKSDDAQKITYIKYEDGSFSTKKLNEDDPQAQSPAADTGFQR